MGQSFFAGLVRRGRSTVVDPEVVGDGPVYQWPNPAKPSAVLVPPLVRAHRVRVRVRKILIGTVAATAAVSVLGAAGSVWLASSAKSERTAAEHTLVEAQAAIAKWQPYAYYAGQLQERQQALGGELAGDIDYSTLARTVVDAEPNGISLTGLEVTPGQPCPTPQPFDAQAALGCVKISGKSTDDATVGRFVDKLNTLSGNGLTGAFANSLSKTSGALDFTVTVNYTDAVLSYRYVPAPGTSSTDVPAQDTAEEPAATQTEGTIR